jgi:hypothetical protein
MVFRMEVVWMLPTGQMAMGLQLPEMAQMDRLQIPAMVYLTVVVWMLPMGQTGNSYFEK